MDISELQIKKLRLAATILAECRTPSSSIEFQRILKDLLTFHQNAMSWGLLYNSPIFKVDSEDIIFWYLSETIEKDLSRHLNSFREDPIFRRLNSKIIARQFPDKNIYKKEIFNYLLSKLNFAMGQRYISPKNIVKHYRNLIDYSADDNFSFDKNILAYNDFLNFKITHEVATFVKEYTTINTSHRVWINGPTRALVWDTILSSINSEDTATIESGIEAFFSIILEADLSLQKEKIESLFNKVTVKTKAIQKITKLVENISQITLLNFFAFLSALSIYFKHHQREEIPFQLLTSDLPEPLIPLIIGIGLLIASQILKTFINKQSMEDTTSKFVSLLKTYSFSEKIEHLYLKKFYNYVAQGFRANLGNIYRRDSRYFVSTMKCRSELWRAIFFKDNHKTEAESAIIALKALKTPELNEEVRVKIFHWLCTTNIL